MNKKNFYCERLNAEDQNRLSGGDESRGGTDLGGPSSGGGDDTVCVCACSTELPGPIITVPRPPRPTILTPGIRF